MPRYSVREAAGFLGVSDDTVRRWIDSGRIAVVPGDDARRTVDGADLARLAEDNAAALPRPDLKPIVLESARNRFIGLVTRVVRDTVMAQVDIQAGPHRLVSLMSREAADELRLQPGVTVIAAVKSTNVIVEVPGR